MDTLPPGPPVQFGPEITNDNVRAGYTYISNSLFEQAQYFYHPDHLGSTAIITDRHGTATQFIAYLPFGEALVSEHTTRRGTPFKFTAKEFDSETGLYYFGARYFDPRIAIWYGVDPMRDLYPHKTAYHFCSNNPIRYIDPDGRDDIFNARGIFLRHSGNPTDNVMIEGADGNLMRITSFNFSRGQDANREMLSNVATHYAGLVGIDQQIGVLDVSRAGAFASTDRDTRQISISIHEGQINQHAETGNNFMNTLVHEGVHKGGDFSELNAIRAQTGHSTWGNTTEGFKMGIAGYAISRVPNEINRPDLQCVINAINSNIGTSASQIFLDGNNAIPMLPSTNIR